jgi:hypothetical protein
MSVAIGKIVMRGGAKEGHGRDFVKRHHGVVAFEELTQSGEGSMRVDVVSSRAELHRPDD